MLHNHDTNSINKTLRNNEKKLIIKTEKKIFLFMNEFVLNVGQLEATFRWQTGLMYVS